MIVFVAFVAIITAVTIGTARVTLFRACHGDQIFYATRRGWKHLRLHSYNAVRECELPREGKSAHANRCRRVVLLIRVFVGRGWVSETFDHHQPDRQAYYWGPYNNYLYYLNESLS